MLLDSGAWASGLRVWLGDPCGGVRQATMQAICNHRCTPMHTDWPESGRFVHGRNPATELVQSCQYGGHCPIGVHLCASVVPNSLLASSRATRSRSRRDAASHLTLRGATCLTVQGVLPRRNQSPLEGGGVRGRAPRCECRTTYRCMAFSIASRFSSALANASRRTRPAGHSSAVRGCSS